jgi:hypothetical protein
MAYFIGNIEYSKEEYEIKKKEIQAHVALINSYVQKIKDGVITLTDVPAEYYDEVYAIINAPVPEEPDPDQEFIDRLISEVNANE